MEEQEKIDLIVKVFGLFKSELDVNDYTALYKHVFELKYGKRDNIADYAKENWTLKDIAEVIVELL